MTNRDFDWVDKEEAKKAEERSKDYFNIVEGTQQFVLLTHCAPLAQVFDKATNKYRPAEEGERGASIKGVCWVLQDGVIKQAKLPYTVVKDIRALRDMEDWEFTIPFLHPLTLTAKGAGTKEVEYSLNPSPKKIELTQDILDELSKKPTPEEVVEKIKGGKVSPGKESDEETAPIEYPEAEEEGISPADIPF